jgi:hypothetical protein
MSAQWFTDNFTEEERKVLKIYHESENKRAKENAKLSKKKLLVIPVKELGEKTDNGELVIDTELTLTYPLNDPRLDPEARLLYLKQEEIMMEKISEGDDLLSSPAKEESLSLESASLNQMMKLLKEVPEEKLNACREREKEFVRKIYGDIDE